MVQVSRESPRSSKARSLGLAFALAMAAVLGTISLGAVAQTRGPGTAARAPDGPHWSELSPSQKEALKPLEHDWDGIDANRKQKWMAVAQRFPHMTPDERTRIQGRMNEWVKLSPMQRGQARLNFQGAQTLTPEERQRRWEAYQQLPEEQRRQLAARGAHASEPSRKTQATQPAGDGTQKKINTVPNPYDSGRQRAVAPAVVQARPGATTNLVTNKPTPPTHTQTGQPKIAATPEFVDSATLLPQRGPQAAATESARHQRP